MNNLRSEADFLPLSFKIAGLVVLVAVCYAAAPQERKADKKAPQLSEKVKTKIKSQLDRLGSNSLAAFTSDGELKQGTLRNLQDQEVRSYESLKAFITENPVDNCRHPTPSPPCVICEDGKVVCSNAPFSGGEKKEKY